MNINKIRNIIEDCQKKTTAPLGIVFRDLASGETVSLRGEEAFPTASMYKLYILAELFRKVYAGECDLTDRIPFTKDQISIGSGVLKNLDEGAQLTLKDYATLMMIISDNSATNVLFRFVGEAQIRKNVLEPLGFEKTRCDLDCTDLLDLYFDLRGGTVKDLRERNGGQMPSFRNSDYYRCSTGRNNQTAPLEAAKMLELLYKGQWVSEDISNQMLNILKVCQTNTRIPYYLPFGTEVAHKTGTLDRLAVDTGIVYSPAGDYILCLFYNGNLASEKEYEDNAKGYFGTELLARLSEEIYNAYQE